MKKIYLSTVILFFTILSCKKDVSKNVINLNDKENLIELKTSFSKILAKAIDKESSLRLFLKKEALKKFDMDNDVLVQMVIDEKIDSRTFGEILSAYSEDPEQLKKLLEKIPTLTIFVPEVPNFSPKNWNIDYEIPVVALAPEINSSGDIFLYDSKGKESIAPKDRVPGFPVIVVKESERVSASPTKSAIKNIKNLSSALVNESLIAGSGQKFYFVDQAFKNVPDVSRSDVKYSSKSNDNEIMRNVDLPNQPALPEQPTAGAYPVDQKNVEAFNRNVEWHRDFVYYGIDPNTGADRGKFNNRYTEYITSIKVLTPDSQLSSEANDPHAVDSYQWGGSRWPTPVKWTDGSFELRINVLINSKNGAGENLSLVVHASGTDLYDVTYTRDGNSVNWYKATSVSKEFQLNLPLIPWNLENYGSAWKFTVFEFDNSTTTTLSYTNTTKYATNFSFDASFGEKVKIGPKFGSSTETTETNSFQVVSTSGSNELGSAILDFSYPIILRKETYTYTPVRGSSQQRERYVTREINGGSFIMSVEPRYL